ncbi:MAG TPA: lysylphosphatidylglycerol synthase transmembrane domain-containing protein [Chloroflexota bacterium]|nr:lysylphosphatidylglycerol synthase transmembrane domain-containing protein [Chloroflexota bacterium]
MSAGRILRPVIGIGISVACLALLARSVPLGDVVSSLRSANLLLLIPAVPLYFLGTAVRSLRWQRLMRGYPVAFPDLFRALVIGLTLNDLLPGRLGEVARIFLVARHGVPVGTSLAAIVVERVLDGIALTVLLVVGILLSGAGDPMRNVAAASAVLFAVVTIALLWAGSVPGPSRWVGIRVIRLFPERFHGPLERAMETALSGLGAIANPTTGLVVLGLSLVAWVIEAGMYRVIMAGFALPGSMAVSMMGAAVANLATLVPSSPGYVGTFDVALKELLVDVVRATPPDAVGFTLTVHLVLIVPVVVAGLFFLWQENISIPEITRRPRRATEPPVAGR